MPGYRTIVTVGVIARELGEPLHRVEYALRSRAIEPTGMAGKARVFPPEAIERVAAVLREIDARREGGRR